MRGVSLLEVAEGGDADDGRAGGKTGARPLLFHLPSPLAAAAAATVAARAVEVSTSAATGMVDVPRMPAVEAGHQWEPTTCRIQMPAYAVGPSSLSVPRRVSRRRGTEDAIIQPQMYSCGLSCSSRRPLG